MIIFIAGRLNVEAEIIIKNYFLLLNPNLSILSFS